MDYEAEICRPRRKKGEGPDPLIVARAPPSIIALVRAKAETRRVKSATIIREALLAYCRDEGQAA